MTPDALHLAAWHTLARETADALAALAAADRDAVTDALRLHLAPLLDHGDAAMVCTTLAAAAAVVQADHTRRTRAKARRVAVHEAGHAVAAHALGVPLRSVSIAGEAAVSEGRVTMAATGGEVMAILAYAGHEAERLDGLPYDPDPSSGDYAAAVAAVRAARADLSEPEELALLAFTRTRAREVLRRRWPAVVAVRDALLCTPTLPGEFAVALMDDALSSEAAA